MNTCEFEDKLISYFDSEISAKKSNDLFEHIQRCEICKPKLDALINTEKLLFKRKRQVPDANILSEYYKNLYDLTTLKRRAKYHIIDIFSARLLRYAAILLVGILIGRAVFYNNNTSEISYNLPVYYANPVNLSDLEYLNYYLVASEMILLELSNSEADDMFFTRETAQKLLIKTFVVHETALQLNNPRILYFVKQMEQILYDLANSDNQEIEKTLELIKPLIVNTGLIQKSKELQEFVQQSKNLLSS